MTTSPLPPGQPAARPVNRTLMARLRGPSGSPALRTRAAAALVVIGMVVLTAPVVVVPIVRGIIHAFF